MPSAGHEVATNASMKGPLESRHTSSERSAACSWAMQLRAANDVVKVFCHAAPSA
jgi:hypothetical protein